MQDLSIGYEMIVAYHSKLKIYHSVISDFHSCDELKFKCLIGVQKYKQKCTIYRYRFKFCRTGARIMRKFMAEAMSMMKTFFLRIQGVYRMSCKQQKRKKLTETIASVYQLNILATVVVSNA